MSFMNSTYSGRLVTSGLIFLILTLSIGSSVAFAQGFSREDMAERMKAQIDEVVTELALAEEKEVQVRGILESEAEERASIIQGFQGQDRNARQMMREEMGELSKRTNEQLSAVLSEEEMEKYDKILKEIRERRRAQFGGGRRGGGGQVQLQN